MSKMNLVETGIAFAEASAAALGRMGGAKGFITASIAALSLAAAAFAPQEVSAGTRAGIAGFGEILSGGTESVASVAGPTRGNVTRLNVASPTPAPRG